jgi:hypothetical protein
MPFLLLCEKKPNINDLIMILPSQSVGFEPVYGKVVVPLDSIFARSYILIKGEVSLIVIKVTPYFDSLVGCDCAKF